MRRRSVTRLRPGAAAVLPDGRAPVRAAALGGGLAEGRSVYTRADGAYEVVIETAAGAPDAVLRQLTGREAAALDPVYLAWPQADQRKSAWTGADDEGELGSLRHAAL